MVSDDVLLCARALECQARTGLPLASDECRRLARILTVAAGDVAAIEGLPLEVRPVRPAPDVVAWPARSLCVTPPPPPGATARILPFRRPT